VTDTNKSVLGFDRMRIIIIIIIMIWPLHLENINSFRSSPQGGYQHVFFFKYMCRNTKDNKEWQLCEKMTRQNKTLSCHMKIWQSKWTNIMKTRSEPHTDNGHYAQHNIAKGTEGNEQPNMTHISNHKQKHKQSEKKHQPVLLIMK